MISILNAGENLGLVAYTNQFGELGEIYEGHQFGKKVWRGMLNMYMHHYRYNYRFPDFSNLTLGWFCMPIEFSRSSAALPYMQGRDKVWYPAVFGWQEGELIIMACLHIVLRNSRPWWVHVTRVRNTLPVMDLAQ